MALTLKSRPRSGADREAVPARLTKQRRLRSGISIWQGRAQKPIPLVKLAERTTADVVIIGAGISGALIAESLAAEGLSVIVVDRRAPLEGSTPVSTALLQYEIDTPLTKLSARIGKQKAQRLWRRSRLALDALRERARWLKIDADLANRDSLYLAGNVLDGPALEAESEARREIGLNCLLLSADDVQAKYGIAGRSALLGFDNLEADPRRLAAGFLSVASRHGVRIVAGYELAAVKAHRQSVGLTSAHGQTLSAGAVIFATGYEFLKGIPLVGHSIGSTWAMATHPQPAKLWPGRCFIWEASDPYLYMRTGPRGSVICGGEDEDFTDATLRDKATPQKIAVIRQKLAAMMPGIDTEPAYVWSGSFGRSRTGTPTIGRIPRMPNCYAAMGYGGNGITFSMLAAQLLTTTLTGGTDPDADLVSFSRNF